MGENEDKYDELIQRFLARDLNKQELSEFYKILEQDEVLAERVAMETIILEGRAVLKEKLEKIHQQMGKPVINIYPYLMKIAAIVIIILSVGYLTYYFVSNREPVLVTEITDTLQQDSIKQNPADNIFAEEPEIKKDKIEIDKHVKIEKKSAINEKEKIAEVEESDDFLLAQNFTPYETVVTRSANEELNKAHNYYKEGKYDSAIIIFEEGLLKATDNNTIDQVMFYAANCYLVKAMNNNKKEDFSQAETYFRFLVEGSENKYTDQSKWYLALTWYNMGKSEECKNILKQIIDQQGFNYKYAERLLKKINE